MKFGFEARCAIDLEYQEGQKKSKHYETRFFLDCSPNLDRSHYIDKNNVPTKEGSKALSNVFIQGLIGNIHLANEKGYLNDAEHLRYIISELEKGFVSVVKIDQTKY